MSASIQWHVGTLRLWSVGMEGQAFDYVCSLIADERKPDDIILFATMVAPPIARLPEIGKVLLEAGFKTVWWERRTRNRRHWVPFDLTKLMKKRILPDGTNQDPLVEVSEHLVEDGVPEDLG